MIRDLLLALNPMEADSLLLFARSPISNQLKWTALVPEITNFRVQLRCSLDMNVVNRNLLGELVVKKTFLPARKNNKYRCQALPTTTTFITTCVSSPSLTRTMDILSLALLETFRDKQT